MAKKEKDYSQIDSEIYNELVRELEELRPLVYRFYNDKVKAPSSAIRLGLQRIKSLSQDMRIEISQMKKIPKQKK